MRDIRFKGLSLTNKWVYGFYVRCDNDHYIYTIKPILTDKETNFYENGLTPVNVFSNSVSQFTGLKDINGLEIWENDRIFVDEHYHGDNLFKEFIEFVKFEDGNFCVENESTYIMLDSDEINNCGIKVL